MIQMSRYIRWTWAGLAALLTVAGCAKMTDYQWDVNPSYQDPGKDPSAEDLAIGTLRSKDGVRYIKLDGTTCSQVMNPETVSDIKDGTRVFLEFRYVVSGSVASFCTDAILVEWASPIDQGGVSILDFEESYSAESIGALTYSDPMNLVFDWITSLEDGFLTLHYTIPTSGERKHSFTLYRSMGNRNLYYLIHNAEGDTKGTLTDGIVCFDVSPLLPQTGEEAVELSFVYIDLNHTEKRLTVDYRSPK